MCSKGQVPYYEIISAGLDDFDLSHWRVMAGNYQIVLTLFYDHHTGRPGQWYTNYGQ